MIDKEIIELWAEKLLEEDVELRKQLEKIEQSAHDRFMELIITGKTTYHIPYEK
jgi:hypothetical protein